MAYAEIHLKSGNIVRFECTEITVVRDRQTGELVRLEWEEEPDHVPMYFDPTAIEYAAFVKGDLPQ